MLTGFFAQSMPSNGLKSWFSLEPGQLGVLVALGAILFVAMRWRKVQMMKAAQKKQQEQPARQYAAPSAPSTGAVRAEVQAMLADIEETTRRAAAQIENRCQKLDALIAEADRKIKELDAKLGQEAAPRQVARVEERVDPVVISQHKPIYDLADRGQDARQIAQALGKQPGEVELVLALRKSGQR